jgi:isocitrate lyase
VELLFVALTVARQARGGDKSIMRTLILLAAALPLLSGCVVGTVAKTAVDVATLPVKVVSAGVDAATTSQKEADEKRVRELRKQDEERGRQARLAAERCRKGKALPSDDCGSVAQR